MGYLYFLDQYHYYWNLDFREGEANRLAYKDTEERGPTTRGMKHEHLPG